MTFRSARLTLDRLFLAKKSDGGEALKRWRIVVCLALMATVLSVTSPDAGWAQGMMGGEGMREMMQQMTGDMLSPAMDPGLLPDPDSQGALLLQRFCSRCHHVPGPGLHTAAEWPAVVERMKGYMASMGKSVPEERTVGDIVGFLQQHGRNEK